MIAKTVRITRQSPFRVVSDAFGVCAVAGMILIGLYVPALI